MKTLLLYITLSTGNVFTHDNGPQFDCEQTKHEIESQAFIDFSKTMDVDFVDGVCLDMGETHESTRTA